MANNLVWNYGVNASRGTKMLGLKWNNTTGKMFYPLKNYIQNLYPGIILLILVCIMTKINMFVYAEVIKWKNLDKPTLRLENNRDISVRIVVIIPEISSICSQKLKENHCMYKLQNNEKSKVSKILIFILTFL